VYLVLLGTQSDLSDMKSHLTDEKQFIENSFYTLMLSQQLHLIRVAE